MRCFALFLVSAFIVSTASFAAGLSEEFPLPDLNGQQWCPCQINMSKAPLVLSPDPDEAGDGIAQITVDENSLGGNVCRNNAPEFECGAPINVFSAVPSDPAEIEELDTLEFLGDSFIAAKRPEWLLPIMRANPYCTDEVLARAKAAGEEGECIQRQELRLQKKYVHTTDQPHLYSFRFRMPSNIEDKTNSIRWITAQWKQEPISETYKALGEEWAPSPFLAQRFDDGVLHITVQDEHCRCMVASARLPDGSVLPWQNGTPQYCLSTEPGKREGQACTPDLKAEYGVDPILSSPIGRWVDLSYRVQAGRSGPAFIEISEGNRMVVRVTGKIGYEPKAGEESQTKFKIGQYRDYMPFVHTMDIDRFRLEPITP